MVVDILVYVEGCKDVECVAEVDFPRNSYITSKDWEKVSGTDHGVDVHDRHDPILASIGIGFNDPHTVVGVGVIEGFAEVMNECA